MNDRAAEASAVDALLADARLRIHRWTPLEVDAAVRGGALVVDIRPAHQRRASGEIPGSVVVERNELEWRCDPDDPASLDGLDGRDRRIVVVCEEGYASSLAAAVLRDLGHRDVGDLDGGVVAWRTAGLALVDGGGPAAAPGAPCPPGA